MRSHGECTILQEMYDDSKCPFCKADRSDVNGLRSKPSSGKKKVAKKIVLKATNVYVAVLERIRFVANHHGADWRGELRFLEAVKAELIELAKAREDARWRTLDEEPGDGQFVLMTVVEESEDKALVRIGQYKDGNFETETKCYAFAWKPLCDPWEVLSEAEDDDEQNEAE